MQLLWTYSIFLEDEKNDEEVLTILTDVIECDVITNENIEHHLKEAERLKELNEMKIYEEVLDILHNRKQLYQKKKEA